MLGCESAHVSRLRTSGNRQLVAVWGRSCCRFQFGMRKVISSRGPHFHVGNSMVKVRIKVHPPSRRKKPRIAIKIQKQKPAKKKSVSIKVSQEAEKTFYEIPCHFCGEDHHPRDCDTNVCLECNKMASKCKCLKPFLEMGCTLYEEIASELWEQIPSEDIEKIKTRLNRDGLLKTVAFAVKKYPTTSLRFWKPLVKGAKRQPEGEAQRYGNCYG